MARLKKKVKESTASEIMPEIQYGSVELGNNNSEARRINKIANLAIAATEGSRRNRSSTIERSDKYANIEDSLTPFDSKGDSKITAATAVELCQKAYYNFPIFRNTIELMVEFSTNNIYYRGGSEKSRTFFDALFNKVISIYQLQDKFFREYYRSGNVFLYRHDSEIKPSDIKQITQTFGALNTAPVKLPIKYIILNPTDIEFEGSYAFGLGHYFKTLNSYEVNLLKNRRTKEDELYFNSLPQDVQQQINNNVSKVLLPLNGDAFYPVFYKKQDYEPFSVPMGYGVLSDINWKEELKKMDMALARVIQQVILLVTTGAEPEKGGINQRNIENLRKIFENQSIGRVLVADYTTKAEFVIPQIADILDPKKYQIVNEDIQLGLHNILVGDEKFANQSIKVQLFVEKLRQARRAFIDDFLLPEIKRIAQDMGFKNYPTPYFEEFDLKNEVEFARIYTRLAEIGILTPEETVKAIETGVLPDSESSVISQRKFKEYKDEKLYYPIATTGQEEKLAQSGGRPTGTTRKQSTKKISPIGASSQDIVSICKTASELDSIIESKLKKIHKIKTLSSEQLAIAKELATIIIVNEENINWLSSVDNYINGQVPINEVKKQAVEEFASANDLTFESAALAYQVVNK